VIGLPRDGDAGLALSALVAALRERGLFALFVEGGGVTVSRWAKARLLDRLQIAIAPVFIGAGRPALQLPLSPTMAKCLRPPSRVFRLGEDLLWDFDLRADAAPTTTVDEAAIAPQRIR
jgi:riboflavin biosynthesis pyrimidine reductase